MTATTPSGSAAGAAASGPAEHPAQTVNLIMATVAFAISFWAWNVIGPLGVRYSDLMHLSSGQASVLVAIPVLVGSVVRIVTGALTDRLGGRVMFSAILIISAPFVILVGIAGDAESYAGMLVVGFFLGVAGTTFAVGIPFVTASYPSRRRGFATGVFGAGMGGTALSSFFTPRLVNGIGYLATHIVIAAALVLVALLCWFTLRKPASWQPSSIPVMPKIAAAVRLKVTWQMSLLYAIVFGGFVAFSTYLPTYLEGIYGFDVTSAGTRTASFAIVAVVARPVGGVLSDKFGAKIVVMISTAGTAIMAVVAAFQPAPDLGSGTTFVTLALFLGLGTGGVFAWVPLLAPAERVGSVTGVVGAGGGLGGFFPPIVMGLTYHLLLPGYGLGLALLTVFAACGLALTLFLRAGRKPGNSGPVPQEARRR